MSRASKASCVAAAFFLFLRNMIYFCQNYSGLKTLIKFVKAATENLEKAKLFCHSKFRKNTSTVFVHKSKNLQNYIFFIICHFEDYFDTKINIAKKIFIKKCGENRENVFTLSRGTIYRIGYQVVASKVAELALKFVAHAPAPLRNFKNH